MATYNFTVRATDNSGSFADRGFSMTVNNTQVDRFVAVTNNGLIRSKDGVTWDREDGIYAQCVTWGNGQWVAHTLAGTYVLVSPDAMNWTRKTVSFDTVKGGGTLSGFTRIKYRGGKWWGFVINYDPTGSYAKYDVYKSDDALSWVYHSSLPTQYAQNWVQGVMDFDHDPVSGVALVTCFDSGGGVRLWRLKGTTWTEPTMPTQAFVMKSYIDGGSWTMGAGRVYFENGLWVVCNGTSGVWTGYNGYDWTFRDVAPRTSNALIGVSYSNGRLLVPVYGGSSAGGYVITSVDAGRTWGGSIPAGGMYSAVYSTSFRQNIASFNGTTVIVEGPGNYLTTFRNDFGTMTRAPMSTYGATQVYAVDARLD